MIQKAKKSVKRNGGQSSTKFLFNVEILNFFIPETKEISESTTFVVSIERGRKLTTTEGFTLSDIDGGWNAKINQTLTIDVTLYKDNLGSYEVKNK